MSFCDDGVVTDSEPDFAWLPDLALRPLGGTVIWANDETFAEKENLISQGPATFRPGRSTTSLSTSAERRRDGIPTR